MFTFVKESNPQMIYDLIEKSNKNNRIPLVLSGKKKKSNKDQFFDSITETTGKKVFSFDLQYCHANSSNRNILNKYK